MDEVTFPYKTSDDIFEAVKKPIESLEKKTIVETDFTDTSDLNGSFDLYKTNQRLLFIF